MMNHRPENYLPPFEFHGVFDAQTRAALRRRRMGLGLTYNGLSRFLEIHWSTLRKWENGLVQHCSGHFHSRVAGFLRGDFDYDIQCTLGDPRKGAYLHPASGGAVECVRHLTNCYHLLESRPDLRALLLDAAFRAAKDTLKQLFASPTVPFK